MILENAGICQNCFIKFNEYDEHYTLASQIRDELVSMYRHSATSFVDVKQEIKVEQDEYYYGFDETIVEMIEPENFRKMSNKKKPSTIKFVKPEIVSVSSGSGLTRKTSYLKKDKDAGLITCMINGVKHYQCEFCGKKDFTSRSRLKTHMQIHTSERNFMCQTCEASFKTMNCLKNHSRLHTNIFYHCDLCTSRFKGKHELRCHMVNSCTKFFCVFHLTFDLFTGCHPLRS